jgi:DNA mismatch repair protein MutS
MNPLWVGNVISVIGGKIEVALRDDIKDMYLNHNGSLYYIGQIGSYVPATAAQLPIYDSIFTRIGASDQLSEGLSTFMVEMTETAQMLSAATTNSLLILDEVGRGTATHDGMCLAQAILEFILNDLKSHVLFATHYHELTALDQNYQQIKNAHMKVLDNKDGSIEFLHVLMAGSAGKSYGIKVAELAGVPTKITQRAELLLKSHELGAISNSASFAAALIPKLDKPVVPPIKAPQMSLFEAEDEVKKQKLIEELRRFSVQKSSPLQALNKIAEWQDTLN